MDTTYIYFRKTNILLLSCLYLITLFIGATSARQLIFVQAIWRHGDRAPFSMPYPNDKNDESCWPNGWLDLTEIGVQQLSDLGFFFRNRYAESFVNSTFDKTQVQIFSSKETRALESAESMCRSLFADSQNSKKNPAAKWKPIPIYTAPDYLIKPTSFDCPKYNKLREEIMPDIIANITSKYSSFFKFLGNVSGYGANITYEQVLQIYDVSREVANGFPQPNWVYKVWREYDGNSTLDILKEIQRLRRFHENANKQFSYLKGASLLGHWLKKLKNLTEGIQTPRTKMVLYSSHDGTLQAFMHVMEISNYQLIPYAACIIMEVYEKKPSEYEIEIFFRDTDGNIDVIIPYNCTFPCPLNAFLKIYQPKAIFSFRDLVEECEVKDCIYE